MNAFFLELLRVIQKNVGTAAILMLFAVIGAFLAGQMITKRTATFENEHARFTAELEKNARDITAINARFEMFRDEMRLKLEEMNGNIIRILAILQPEK